MSFWTIVAIIVVVYVLYRMYKKYKTEMRIKRILQNTGGTVKKIVNEGVGVISDAGNTIRDIGRDVVNNVRSKISSANRCSEGFTMSEGPFYVDNSNLDGPFANTDYQTPFVETN